MSNPPKLVPLLALLLSVGLGACSQKKDTTKPEDTGPAACTEEAKVCEDGSSVAREGPACEFAACPEDATPDSDVSDADAEPDDADAEPDDADADPAE